MQIELKSPFHVLAIVNSAAVNTGVHVSFQTMFFSSYVPRNGIAGSYGSSMFSFLRNLCTVLHSGCINLHFHQQCRRVPFTPHPLQHPLFVDFLFILLFIFICGFFDDSHFDWCEVILVVLICISLIIGNTELLFLCLSGHLYVFFGEMSMQVFCLFFD